MTDIQIYAEDCLAGMKARLREGEISAVVTSPPYNLGVAYKNYKDRLKPDDYLNWLEEVALEIRRVLSPEGSFFLNIGSTAKNPWLAMDVARRIKPHFVLQNHIVWVKSIALSGESVGKSLFFQDTLAVGHFKPINSPRYLNHCHESLFHFTKSGGVALERLAVGVPYQDKSNVGRWKAAKADLRCRGNVWFVPYKTIRSRDMQRPHPSTFPVELAEMCVKLHGVAKTRRVLDPFMGIGSTALACRRLGVPFVGFEIDPTYTREAKRLLNLNEEKA